MKVIDIATNNQPKKIRRIMVLGFINSFLRVLPYGILIGATLELFEPLFDPSKDLNTNKLWLYFIGIVAIYVLQFFVGRYKYIKTFDDVTTLVAEGRINFAKHMRNLPMGYFARYDSGQFSSYLLEDYENILTLISEGLEPIVSSVVIPIATFIGMSFISFKMALVMFIPVILSIPTALIAKRISNYFGAKVINSRCFAASRMLEYLRSISVVKAFNLVGERFERLEKSFSDLRKDSIKLEFSTGLGVVLGEMILYSGIPLLIFFGFLMVKSGSISIPVYIMFLMISPKVYNPLATGLSLTALISFYSQSATRIEAVKNVHPLPEPNMGKKPTSFDISFEDVTFKYENINVIDNITFDIPAKSITALVGPSGSGKTTITRLISRFWDVNAGCIYIGGIPLQDMTIDECMKHISIVFQDVYLFNDTIFNNISFGRSDATKEEVVKAAKAASCHEFIMDMPRGYDTIIGEGGCTLSGGEKQRISIARAILKDAPIILLDEATASLDPENEVYIQAALNSLVQDKTLVVIAHRLKTIVDADQIIVLNNGKIMEKGKHEDLISNNGLYFRMWNKQEKTKSWNLKGVFSRE